MQILPTSGHGWWLLNRASLGAAYCRRAKPATIVQSVRRLMTINGFLKLEMSQSPELAGGEGFTFEGDAAAFYLAALLPGRSLRGPSACDYRRRTRRSKGVAWNVHSGASVWGGIPRDSFAFLVLIGT